MRKSKEVELAIQSVKKDRETAPEFSYFGNNNYLIIDYGLDVLEGRIIEDDVWHLVDAEEISEDERFAIMSYVEYLDGTVEIEDLLFDQTNLVTATEAKLVVCDKMCKECPFSNKSFKGFLADYTIEDFEAYMRAEISFPCHMQMPEGDTSPEEAAMAVNKGEMTLCRGYVESIIKSAKMPYKNPQLIEAINMVKEQGTSEDSMSIFEFRNYHDLQLTK